MIHEITLAFFMMQASTETGISAPVEEIEIVEEKPDPVTGEFPVDPYIQSDSNAGAKPFTTSSMAAHFGGQPGIRKMTDRLVDISLDDQRISDIFKGQDTVRLRRTLFEQFCYLLAAGCTYTGRDMRAAHADMGLERNDLNALVENLQQAMVEQKIPFQIQNRFLSKLAPMEADVLQK